MSTPKVGCRHSGRRGGTGCCCCCCCLEWLAWLILKIVVILALTIIVSWLILRHHAPRFNVEHASLQLMLPPRSAHVAKNRTLRYNLAVNMSIRNPNHAVGIYYDGFQSKALFSEQRSGGATSNFQPSFFQHAKNTTNLHLVFKGLNQTMRSGNERFDVALKVHLKIRLKLLWVIKVKRFNSTIECDLKNTTSSLTFERTRCYLDLK